MFCLLLEQAFDSPGPPPRSNEDDKHEVKLENVLKDELEDKLEDEEESKLEDEEEDELSWRHS
jgi:hypothetical protein